MKRFVTGIIGNRVYIAYEIKIIDIIVHIVIEYSINIYVYSDIYYCIFNI